MSHKHNRNVRKNHDEKLGSSRNSPSFKEPATKTITYNGPIRLVSADAEQSLHSLQLVNEFQITSSGAGIINNVFPSSPNGCADWSSLALVFDEYRTLGFRVEFYPDNRYSKTTTNCTPLLCVIDRDNAAALTTYTLGAQYESCMFVSIEDPWKREVKMNGIEDSGFVNTTSPAPTFYMKLYGQNLSVSTGYGLVIIRYLVQFRGVGV
jgi:hypothetical protein